MATTPRPLIDSVVRSVCGHEVERVVRLTGGGMNETYRVELPNDVAVVVRIARQPVPWFTDEEHIMAQARAVALRAAPGRVISSEYENEGGWRYSFDIQQRGHVQEIGVDGQTGRIVENKSEGRVDHD